MTDEEITRAHCNKCGHDTNHLVVAERQQSNSEIARLSPYEDGFKVRWEDRYLLLECRGCEEVSVKRIHWFSEQPEGEHVEYYPPRVSRREPTWLQEVPIPTRDLMLEIYGALQADHRRIALMGARSVIDSLMLRQVGDAGSFVDKLDALEQQGFLSEVNRNILEAALEAGHAAVHRGYEPSAKDLGSVMDIVENVLQAELLSGKAEDLKDSTPPRGSTSNAVSDDEGDG